MNEYHEDVLEEVVKVFQDLNVNVFYSLSFDLEKQKLDLNVFVGVSMNVDWDKDFHRLMVALMVNKVDKLVWNDTMKLNLLDYYILVATKNCLMLDWVDLQ
jgi:hypothetical protein